MFLLCTTLSFVIGLYFARNNIVISVLISLIYLLFVLWRFGKKKFVVFIAFFALGVFIPRITLSKNEGPDYGGTVIDVRDNYYIFQSKLERYYVYAPENDFEIGDKLILKGETKEFKCNTYESQFNFQEYLRNKGAVKEINVYDTSIKRQSIIRIHQFKKRFVSKFDENTATLISAFLFNDKDYSNSSIKLASDNSVLYLFTLSGIYLNILFKIANYLLFLKFSKKTSKILTFIIFLPLAFFSFTKIGTLRVYCLYVMKYVNEFVLTRRKFAHIELVSVLALIFLIFDYHLVYQEAFYIGFLLSAFSPILLNSTKFLSKTKQKFLNLMLFSGLMIPIRVRSSYYSPLFFLKTIILIPVSVSFLVLSITSIFIPIHKPVEFVGKALTWILEKMDAYSLKLPFGNWGGTFSLIFILVFLLLVFYLESIRLRHAKFAVFGILILMTISVVPLQEPISNCVYFVNVGQGDSIIIKNKTHTIMIDTGGQKSFDMAEETLIPFMNKKKITHIDALILTHDDFDHAGAKDSLIENFKVKEILTESYQFPYQIGDLKLENLNTFNFTEENDKSLVISAEFIGKKWLFMGDASVLTEEKILQSYNVDCDILKVGHHGSNTSSSEKFIKAASPEEAIISCGAKNYYGHPNQEVIDRLKKYNVKIRRTDEEGTISYFSLVA